MAADAVRPLARSVRSTNSMPSCVRRHASAVCTRHISRWSHHHSPRGVSKARAFFARRGDGEGEQWRRTGGTSTSDSPLSLSCASTAAALGMAGGIVRGSDGGVSGGVPASGAASVVCARHCRAELEGGPGHERCRLQHHAVRSRCLVVATCARRAPQALHQPLCRNALRLRVHGRQSERCDMSNPMSVCYQRTPRPSVPACGLLPLMVGG